MGLAHATDMDSWNEFGISTILIQIDREYNAARFRCGKIEFDISGNSDWAVVSCVACFRQSEFDIAALGS